MALSMIVSVSIRSETTYEGALGILLHRNVKLTIGLSNHQLCHLYSSRPSESLSRKEKKWSLDLQFSRKSFIWFFLYVIWARTRWKWRRYLVSGQDIWKWYERNFIRSFFLFSHRSFCMKSAIKGVHKSANRSVCWNINLLLESEWFFS